MASPAGVTVEEEALATETACRAYGDEEQLQSSEETRGLRSVQTFARERDSPATNAETMLDRTPSRGNANADGCVAATLHTDAVSGSEDGVVGGHHTLGQGGEAQSEILLEQETANRMDDAASEGESDDPPVLELSCSTCSTCVCRRGVSVLLVASPQDSLYSTDIPGDNLRLGQLDGSIDTCECQIQQAWQSTRNFTFVNVLRQKRRARHVAFLVHIRVHIMAATQACTIIYASCMPELSIQLQLRVSCAKCEARIGYHVTKPCALCTAMSNNGHYWLFYNDGVTSRQRMQVVATAGLSNEAGTMARTMAGAIASTMAGTEAGTETSTAMGTEAGAEARTEAVAERTVPVGSQAGTAKSPVATPLRWSQLSYNGSEEAPQKGEDSLNTPDVQPQQQICAICMCPMWQPTRLDAPCAHVFCFGCISREVDERGRCPLDRHAITRRSLIRMDEGAA